MSAQKRPSSKKETQPPTERDKQELRKLHEDNERLKSDNDELQKETSMHKNEISALRKENRELKNETMSLRLFGQNSRRIDGK